MARLVKYRVDGGGTTAVEDSDVLRTGGGESNHHESNISSSKKRVFTNDNSSDEPSNETASVLQIANSKASGLLNAVLFGGCVTVSTESTDDGFVINLQHKSPKALAYKVCNIIWLM